MFGGGRCSDAPTRQLGSMVGGVSGKNHVPTPSIFGPFRGSSGSHDVMMPTVEEEKKSNLMRLLKLQLWNGSWEILEELQRLIGSSQKEVYDVGKDGLKDPVVATLMVLTYLEKEYANERMVWEAIAQKARTFVANSASTEAVSVTSRCVKQLFEEA